MIPKLGDYVEYHSGGVGKVDKQWGDGFNVRFPGGGGCNHSVYSGVAATLVTDPQKIRIYDLEDENALLRCRVSDFEKFQEQLRAFVLPKPKEV